MKKVGRTTRLKTVDAKIEKAKHLLEKTEARRDRQAANLRKLLCHRDEIRIREITSAMSKSRRSFEEVMNFIRT